jgi:hypothetical protein
MFIRFCDQKQGMGSEIVGICPNAPKTVRRPAKPAQMNKRPHAGDQPANLASDGACLIPPVTLEANRCKPPPMPLESAPPQIAPAPRHRIVQVLLLILALFEISPARLDLWMLFRDLSQSPRPNLSWIPRP